MNYLLKGDPLDPEDYDLIAVVTTLDVGEPVPDGFRVTTGNNHFSEIAGVFYRSEIEDQDL